MTRLNGLIVFWLGGILPGLQLNVVAQTTPSGTQFEFPTNNRELLDSGRGPAFYVGTIGKTWENGQFGCVRSTGWQMHEGLDIRPLEHDEKGESSDEVRAVADGEVAYLNRREHKSTYGQYVVLRHTIDGLPVFTLYAHLRAIAEDLQIGNTTSVGQPIGVLGRTAAISPKITKEHAHLHFEIAFMLNSQFPKWYSKKYPGQENSHAEFHGFNLIAIDASEVFLQQAESGEPFSFIEHIRNLPTLFKVRVKAKQSFEFIREHISLVKRDRTAEAEGIAGYELSFTSNGLPSKLKPISASEFESDEGYELVSVDETVYESGKCRRYVMKRQGEWILTGRATDLLNLITLK